MALDPDAIAKGKSAVSMVTLLEIALTYKCTIFVLQRGDFFFLLFNCRPASQQEQVTEERVQRLKKRFMSAYDVTADGKLQIQEVCFKEFIMSQRGNGFVEISVQISLPYSNFYKCSFCSHFPPSFLLSPCGV